jgi:hypothetical protein
MFELHAPMDDCQHAQRHTETIECPVAEDIYASTGPYDFTPRYLVRSIITHTEPREITVCSDCGGFLAGDVGVRISNPR